MKEDDPRLFSEPSWPVDRDLNRYHELLGIEVDQWLKNGGTWIDIGPGINALPMQPFLKRSDICLITIGPHIRRLPPEISVVKGQVPDDRNFFLTHYGQARLVTDVYASLSYTVDPVAALIYGCLLLEEGGMFGGFTELHRIGGLNTWNELIQYFWHRLGIELNMTAIPILEDASGLRATALRVQGKRHQLPFQTPVLDEIVSDLHEIIGHPQETGIIWQSDDGSARISRIEYRKQSESNGES